MKKGPVYEKSFSFALRVVKMNIALKEANETLYWLDLLHQSEYLASEYFQTIQPQAEELVKRLVSNVKSSRVTNPHD